MPNSDEEALLDILERVSKSVVNISTIKLVHHIFYQVVPVKGMCSGTIIDPKGYILTNNHMVGGCGGKSSGQRRNVSWRHNFEDGWNNHLHH